MRPRISMIAVAYNGGKRMIPTLESFRLQDCKEKEVVIADDCSTDNGFTVKTIEEWLSIHKNEFERVIFLKNKTNLGIVANMFNAAQSASGDVLMFCGQGDTLYSDNTINEVAEEIQAQRRDGIADPFFWLGFYRAFSMTDGVFKQVELNKDLPEHHNLLAKNPLLALKRNLLIWDIGGVGTVFSSRFFEKDLFPLSEAPRNWEDGPAFLWALIEGQRIGTLKTVLRWYEVGQGISWEKKKIATKTTQIVQRLFKKNRVNANDIENLKIYRKWVSRLKPANLALDKIKMHYIDSLDFLIEYYTSGNIFIAARIHKMTFIKKLFQKTIYRLMRKWRNKNYAKLLNQNVNKTVPLLSVFNKNHFV